MDKYERILFIDKMISSGSRPTQSEIVRAISSICGHVNRTTVWRDLNELERKFHAPLDKQDYVDSCGRKKCGYIYTEPTFRVPAMFSSGAKIKSAQLMLRLLESVRGNPIYDEAKEVFSELGTEAPVVESNGEIRFRIDNAARIIFLGFPCVSIPNETWQTVRDSIQGNKILQFLYKNNERTVAPYQLIFSHGNWNLWSFEYGSKTRKLFTLSEMTNVRLRSGKANEFVLPVDFDFRAETSGQFGTFKAQEKTRVKIRLRGYAAKYAKIRVWGESQSVLEESEWTTISFTTTQFSSEKSAPGPILTWILGWGSDAVPIEPLELVDLWKEKIRKMNEIAFSKN